MPQDNHLVPPPNAPTVPSIWHHYRAFIASDIDTSVVSEPSLTPVDRQGLKTITLHYSAQSRSQYHQAQIRAKIDFFKQQIKQVSASCIVIEAEKCVDSLCLIYACFEAGICYVPINAAMPAAHKHHIYQQFANSFVAKCSTVQPFTLEHIATESSKRIDAQYVIYTSGTTGKPKGVMVTKSAIMTLCHHLYSILGASCAQHVFSYAELHFDMSVADVFMPYLYGGNIYFCEKTTKSSPTALAHILHHIQPSMLQLTPSALSLFSQDEREQLTTQNLLLGGESVPDKYTPPHLKNVQCLWNFYGPTEATVWCAYKRISDDFGADIHMAIPGYTVLLLNDGQLCRPGEVGEICIAGNLSQGYTEDALTQKAFVYHEFAELSGTFYHTGDNGQLQPCGGIKIVGRRDTQIKFNGHRIELIAIESAVEQIHWVDEVLVHFDQSNHQLIALVKRRDHHYGYRHFIEALKTRLPSSHRPSNVIFVNEIPRNTNDKKQRSAEKMAAILAAIAQPDLSSSRLNQQQKTLLDLFRHYISVHRDQLHNTYFFTHGGDSLKGISFLQDAERFGCCISSDDLVNCSVGQIINSLDKG